MSRIYADKPDLEEYWSTPVPENVDSLVKRASLMVDNILIGAIYKVDEEGMPTEGSVIEALRIATAIHAEGLYLSGSGQEYDSVKIGSVSLSKGSGKNELTTLDEVYSILQTAGLIPVSVLSGAYFGYYPNYVR